MSLCTTHLNTKFLERGLQSQREGCLYFLKILLILPCPPKKPCYNHFYSPVNMIEEGCVAHFYDRYLNICLISATRQKMP
jgi:hypothetical protein